jgi:hypothetical protein
MISGAFFLFIPNFPISYQKKCVFFFIGYNTDGGAPVRVRIHPLPKFFLSELTIPL